MSRMPTFLIVGAPKAGTTSMYRYVKQHPDVFMSPIKEPDFFVSEFRPENVNPHWRRRMETDAAAFHQYLERISDGHPPAGRGRPAGVVTDWHQYLKLFQRAREGQAIGEASVACLWSATAAGAIAERLPEARCLMILRNPADRAFSAYLQRITEDRTRLSFTETIRQWAGDDGADSPTRQPETGTWYRQVDRFLNNLDLGAYAGQVERFLERFPRERLRVYLYEDFSRDPDATVRDVFRFIGVRDDVPLNLTKHYMAPKIPRRPALERRVLRPLSQSFRGRLPKRLQALLNRARFLPRERIVMSANDRATLIDFYADDIRRLATLIGRDLSPWLANTTKA